MKLRRQEIANESALTLRIDTLVVSSGRVEVRSREHACFGVGPECTNNRRHDMFFFFFFSGILRSIEEASLSMSNSRRNLVGNVV